MGACILSTRHHVSFTFPWRSCRSSKTRKGNKRNSIGEDTTQRAVCTRTPSKARPGLGTAPQAHNRAWGNAQGLVHQVGTEEGRKRLGEHRAIPEGLGGQISLGGSGRRGQRSSSCGVRLGRSEDQWPRRLDSWALLEVQSPRTKEARATGPSKVEPCRPASGSRPRERGGPSLAQLPPTAASTRGPEPSGTSQSRCRWRQASGVGEDRFRRGPELP